MGLSITVLGATGLTGRELVRQALERGHEVTAVARDPSKLDVVGVRRAAGDVRDPESMSRALAGAPVIVSGLGVAGGEQPGVLTAGAREVVAAGAGRVVWLGAFGTGPSAAAAGWLTRAILKAMGLRRSHHRLRTDRRPVRPDLHVRRPRRLPGHPPRPRLIGRIPPAGRSGSGQHASSAGMSPPARPAPWPSPPCWCSPRRCAGP